ncbi:MAG: DUF4185 domain-containing protein [Myxococcota bacterium]
MLASLVALVMLVSLAALACAVVFARGLRVGSQADCRPDFRDQDGWLGGDVAASIPLDAKDGRSVWLFGDSFVVRPGEPAVRRYPFVHNAIAVSHCGARGRVTFDFAWGDGGEQAAGDGAVRAIETGSTDVPDARTSSPTTPPRAYFEPDPTAGWVARVKRETGQAPYYWPISGVSIEGTLFVALLRIAPATAHGPFHLPFRAVGVDLARIDRMEGPPERWSVRLSALSSRGDLLPATSLVVEGDHLLAFATRERGDGRTPRVLTRIPLARLTEWRPDLEPFVETLAREGRWRPGLDADAALVLMDDDASEMSVHFDPAVRAWLAVYADPQRGAIRLRRARRLEGPWSAPVELLRIPELAAVGDPEPGEPFCYAGKAHPELAAAGRLVVSYVCNVYADRDDAAFSALERLRTSPGIYRPKLVRLPIPPLPASD